jgi:putative salt-induced outer membrane protein YdiY
MALLLLIFAAAQDVRGQEAKEDIQDIETEIPETWMAKLPEPEEFDWILLTSGEWLKGEIKFLREDSFEFDSDELEGLTFDWEDIAEVHSPNVNSVLFEGDVTAKGKLVIKDDVVRVIGDETQVFDRAKLLAIIPGEPTERNYWDGLLSLGMTARSGNTDSAESNIYFRARRQTLDTRFVGTYNGNYGELDNIENVNNHRVDAKYDVFLSRVFYMTPLSLQLYRDPFQNIDLQATPATGVGFHVIDRGDMTWDLEPAIGYRYTKFESVEAGEDKRTTTGAFIARTFYEMDITSKTDLTVDYSVSLGFSTPHNNIHHLMAKTTYELTDTLDIDLTFAWDRISDPTPDSDGVVPKKNDFRITMGIALEF